MMCQCYIFQNFSTQIQRSKEEVGFYSLNLTIQKLSVRHYMFLILKHLGPDKDLTFKPTLFEKLKKNFTNPKKFSKEGFVEKDKYILQSEYQETKKKILPLIADLGFFKRLQISLTGNKSKTKNINHLIFEITLVI